MRIDRRRNQEHGFVLIWAALLLTVFLGAAGISVDLGNWYLHIQRTQRAADSAALAGAALLPAESASDEARAVAEARHVLLMNGVNAADAASADVHPTEAGGSEMEVHVGVTVQNSFMRFFGLDANHFTRLAHATWRPPFRLGNPHNVLGNEPVDDPSGVWSADAASGLVGNYWLAIGGGQSHKDFGDRWNTQYCPSGAVDGCTGHTNNEYDAKGMTYRVDVPAGTTGQLVLQMYDPVYANTGQDCKGPGNNVNSNDPRYAKDQNEYCSGDNSALSIESGPPVITTVAERVTGTTTPISACAPQTFGGTNGDIAGRMASDPTFASEYHRWVQLCTVTLSGDRTSFDINVSTSTDSVGRNRYGLRAGVFHSGVLDPTSSGLVSLYAVDKFVLTDSVQSDDVNFFFARVTSGYAGSGATAELFDPGDMETSGSKVPVTIQILPPTEAMASGGSLTAFPSCTLFTSGGTSKPLPNCALTNVMQKDFDGKLLQIGINFPSDYSCADDKPDGCWTRVRYSFPAGTVTGSSSHLLDTTSWSLSAKGSPLRINK